ncbi:SGNH/GDSL hydrolase family protein [Geminocystis sp. CENA526]|uniref:SGNH/GDSL hydrolase family protein n=1 Tax=Geminocystis sp. CENA526 TaxID=1355871 RepID=UPI003D6F4584
MTVIFLGDSLLDIGNLSTTVAPLGIVPFPTPPYSEGKASNGQVLGEAIADRLGIGADSLVGNAMVASPPNPSEENVVYAFAGATTGVFGSKGNNLDEQPIGLLSQVQLFQQNFNGNNPVEVIISAGSNDVLQILADPNFANIFLTPENDDNELLINQTVDEIVNNISQSVIAIENQTENITIIGLSPLGNTPFVIKTDEQINNNIPLDIGGETRILLNEISFQVNQELINIFDNENNDVPNVKVNDGFQVFNNGLTAWENQLNNEAIIDISYVDYISGETNLPPNLTIEQFAFIDGVHPTSAFNQYLADEIVSSSWLNTPMYKFENTDIPNTYLYVGEEERKSVIENYPIFAEKDIDFYVGIEPDDDLIVINRFQNQDIAGTYLYAGEEESQSIIENYPNFILEGIAFYVYGVDSSLGGNIYRFQNQDLPGTYLYATEAQRQDIRQNAPNFIEEGIAFKAII